MGRPIFLLESIRRKPPSISCRRSDLSIRLKPRHRFTSAPWAELMGDRPSKIPTRKPILSSWGAVSAVCRRLTFSKIKNRFSWSGKILSAGILKASRGKESITPWALHILQNRNRATHWTPSFIRRSVYPNYGERLPMIPSSTEIGLFLIFGRVPPIPKTPGILSTRRSISSTY